MSAANPFPAPGALSFFVPGRPSPQGSKHARAIYRKGDGGTRVFTGKVVAVESSKTGVARWRADVVTNALRVLEGAPPIEGPVRLRCVFVLPRPKRLPRSRPTPPHTTRPDSSKLLRSTEDALTTARVYLDDGQITETYVRKRIAEPDETAGAWIDVSPLPLGEDPCCTP